MKTRFIYNPSSGKNRHRPWLLPALMEFVHQQRLAAEVVSTEGRGHATELARAAVRDGFRQVVAVGGDGTMNEVAQALVGSKTTLALVPCGSGNGLAHYLGIPTAPLKALALLANRTRREVAIDTGSANGRPFFNVMGLGFDAEISRSFNRLTRRGLGAYLATGYAAFAHHRPEKCIIHGAGRRECLSLSLIAIANSDQYGNRALIAPGASVDDGMLDLVAVGPITPLSAAPLLVRLFLGTIDQSPRVRKMRDRRFLIERPAPGLIHTDGETHETCATVEVGLWPRSLRIVVPQHCRVHAPVADRYEVEHEVGTLFPTRIHSML